MVKAAMMKVLGIETSCDETAVAIIGDDKRILSNIVLSQLEEHRAFGGVVPEIAARAHMDHLGALVRAALSDAGLEFDDLDAIAATSGPGLIGGVMVGMMAAKAIAAARGLPFIAVNHLEGHALTPRLTHDVPFPYLLLLVSGGHSQILVVEGVGKYKKLGSTIDDAMGECFDKSAKLMGLPHPGGPHVEKAARDCPDLAAAKHRFPLPHPMKGRAGCDFSFSGLKTAVRQHVESLPEGDLKYADIADLCAALQDTMAIVACDRLKHAIVQFKTLYPALPHKPALVVSGGVAANEHIRTALQNLAAAHDMEWVAPPLKLCSDNGAMIAWAGIERLRLGYTSPLDFAARPRWPLEELAQEERQ